MIVRAWFGVMSTVLMQLLGPIFSLELMALARHSSQRNQQSEQEKKLHGRVS